MLFYNLKATDTVGTMVTSNENDPQRGDPSDKLTESAKASARSTSEQVKQQASEQLYRGRDSISEEMSKVAHAAKAAASDLHDQNREGLAEYVTQMADNISGFANSLRGKNVDELMREASDIARKNPALFITGSVAIGFGLSRFAKASNRSAEQQDFAELSQSDQSQSSRAGGAYSSSDDSSWPGGFEESPSLMDSPRTSGDNRFTNPGEHRYE